MGRDADRATVGQVLRALRERRGLTLGALAERAGAAKSYLSMIENHRVANPPSPALLAALARVLGDGAGELAAAAAWQATPDPVREQVQRQREAVGEAQELARWLLDATGRKAGGGRNLDRLFRTGELKRRVQATLGGIASLDDADAPPAAAPPAAPRPGVPLINKVAAGYPRDFTDLGYPARVADETVHCPDVDDPDAFACRVVGDSMTPDYREGDIVVFSPAAPLTDGCDCLARLEPDHETTFKRVFFEGKRRDRIRLVPLNRAYPERTIPRAGVAGLYRAVWRLQRL